MSWLSRFVSQFDPTRKKSFVSGIGRQLDITNKNSLAGKVAPYAVGAIPGIGLPLAAGLGAGIRGAQAVGRGENLGGIAGSALRGAGEAGLTRGIARAVMPGTFAPKAPLASIGQVAALPPAPSMAGVQEGIRNLPMPTGAVGIAAPGAVGGIAGKAALGLGGKSVLGGIGRSLTSAPVIAGALGAGANIYGAQQTGKAMDAQIAAEAQAARDRLALDTQLAQKNIVPREAYDVWLARRRARGVAPGQLG